MLINRLKPSVLRAGLGARVLGTRASAGATGALRELHFVDQDES